MELGLWKEGNESIKSENIKCNAKSKNKYCKNVKIV
jgi:hypothetical protein